MDWVCVWRVRARPREPVRDLRHAVRYWRKRELRKERCRGVRLASRSCCVAAWGTGRKACATESNVKGAGRRPAVPTATADGDGNDVSNDDSERNDAPLCALLRWAEAWGVA